MTKDYILVNYKPFAFIRKVLDFLERDKIFSKKEETFKTKIMHLKMIVHFYGSCFLVIKKGFFSLKIIKRFHDLSIKLGSKFGN